MKEVEKEDGEKKEGEVDDVVETQNSFKIGLTIRLQYKTRENPLQTLKHLNGL